MKKSLSFISLSPFFHPFRKFGPPIYANFKLLSSVLSFFRNWLFSESGKTKIFAHYGTTSSDWLRCRLYHGETVCFAQRHLFMVMACMYPAVAT